MDKSVENKIPLSIYDKSFDEDNVGYLPTGEYKYLFNLNKGTVLVPDSNLKYISVLRKTRLDLIPVANPEVVWVELDKKYKLSSPKTNEKRLEFIMSQRAKHPYKDLGIHPLAFIGEDGMGYEWDNNSWIEFPQNGGVKIGVNVRIGAFTTVKKGTIYDTKIGDGCKIGSHCNIGHNVEIGKNCLLTHRVSIGGSSIIGDRVFFGQGSIVKNKITIGAGAYIGQGANVISNVPSGATVTGNPAKIIKR